MHVAYFSYIRIIYILLMFDLLRNIRFEARTEISGNNGNIRNYFFIFSFWNKGS